MPTIRRCPFGHEWEAPDEASSCPICSAATQELPGGPGAATLAPEPPAAREEARRPRVPGFEVLGELGRGGMGVVYKARQTRLNRVVALKMIIAGGQASAADLRRFRAEAEAIARLQHPNIVQIYNVGEQAGRPYFALEYVPGGSLAQKLDGKPQPPREAARLVELLARGVQAAHAAGIMHRDIKPANILLVSTQCGERRAESGEPESGGLNVETSGPGIGLSALGSLPSALSTFVPKIADFGLAKQIDAGDARTQSGAVLGTPSYMAPEQAQGKKDVGPLADVYALGAILYECLTGRPPFKAATPLDTVVEVITSDVVRPRRLQPQVPRDLETICLKCLEKTPPRRYGSAAALADDLRRFQAGEPLRARPPSPPERAWRWLRRRPAAALGILLLLAIVASTGWWQGGNVYRLLTNRGRLLVENAPPEGRLILRQQGQDVAKYDLHPGQEITLAAGDYEAQLEGDPEGLEVSPERFTLTRNGREILAVRKEVIAARRLSGHKGPVQALALSPDGQHALSASGRHGGDRTLRLWNLVSGQEERQIETDVVAAAFSPDGKLALSGGSDHAARLWDLGTGREIRKLEGHQGPVLGVAFSPDGKRVLTCSRERIVLWEVSDGRQLLVINEKTEAGPVFSPDGRYAVSADMDQILHLWDLEGGKERMFHGRHGGGVLSLAFNPDGRLIASGGGNGQVRLWDVATGKLLRIVRGHSKPVTAVAFSPEGLRLVSGSADRTVRLWDVATGQERTRPLEHSDGVMAIAVAADGRHVLSAGGANFDGQWLRGRDFSLRWWTVPRARPSPPADTAPESQELLVLPAQKGRFNPVTFTPDGKYLLSGSAEGNLTLWDAVTGDDVRVIGKTGEIKGLVISRDGKRALTVAVDGVVQLLWDLESGKQLSRANFWQPEDVALSPNGKLVLVAGPQMPSAQIFDATTGQYLRYLQGQSAVEGVAFSPDGKRALTGSKDGVMRLWDVLTGRELRRFPTAEEVHRVAFSPDGKQALSGALDGSLRLWDLETGQNLLYIASGGIGASAGSSFAAYGPLAFAPDGRRAASSGGGGHIVRLWDLETGFEIHAYKGHGQPVDQLAFSPDGQRLVSGAADGTLRVWRVPPPVLLDQSKFARLELDTDTPAVPLLIWPGNQRRDQAVRGLDTRAVRPVKLPPGAYTVEAAVNGIRVSPEQLTLAAGEARRISARRQETYSGPVMEFELDRGLAISPQQLPFAAQKDRLLVRTADGKLRLLHLPDGKEMRVLPTGTDSTPMALSPDGRLALVLVPKAAQIWDLDKLAIISRLNLKDARVTAGIFLRDGRVLTAAQDMSLDLCEVKTGANLRRFEGHDAPASCLAVSADGKQALSGGQDSTVRLWDLESGKELRRFRTIQRQINGVALALDGTKALAAGDDSVCVWDVASGARWRRLMSLQTVAGAVFSPDGVCVQSWGQNGSEFVRWDLRGPYQFSVSKGFPTFSAWPNSMRAVPGAAPGAAVLLAWNQPEGPMHLWQLAACPTGMERDLPRPDRDSALTVAVDFDGVPSGNVMLRRGTKEGYAFYLPSSETARQTVTGTARGTYDVELRDLPRGLEPSPRQLDFTPGARQVLELRRGPEFVGERQRIPAALGLGRAVPLPDRRHALSTRMGGGLTLWNLETGLVVRVFKGHKEEVWDLAVTPDGKQALSSSSDSLWIWDLASGKGERLSEITAGGGAGALALTADGKQGLVISGNQLVLFDVAARKIVRQWTWGADRPLADLWRSLVGEKISPPPTMPLALSPDGRRALTGNATGRVTLWDVRTGKPVRTFLGHTQPVAALAFAPDGRRMLSGCEGGKICLWELESLEPLRSARLPVRLPGPITTLAFSPDGQRFVAASGYAAATPFASQAPTSVRLWDAQTGTELYRVADYATDLAMLDVDRVLVANPGGLLLRRLTRSDNDWGQLVIENPSSNMAQVQLLQNGKNVLWTNNGNSAFSLKEGNYDLKLQASMPGQSIISRVTIQGGRQKVAQVTRSAATLVKGSNPAAVQEWNLLSARLTAKADAEQLARDLRQFTRKYAGWSTSTVARAALATLPVPLDGLKRTQIPTELLTRVGDGDAGNAPVPLVAVLAGHRGPVPALAFRDDGSVLVTGGKDGQLKVWDLASAHELRSWTAHAGGVHTLAFRPDSGLLASAGADGRVVLWDSTTGQKVRELTGQEGAVRGLAFSPDGELLAASEATPRVRLWRLATGELWKSLDRPGSGTDVEFSPDGSLLLSGGAHRLQIFDLARGKSKYAFPSWAIAKGQGSAFSPNARMIASLAGSGALLYETASGQQIYTLSSVGAAQGSCLAFRPSGTELAIASADGSIRFYSPQTGGMARDELILRSGVNSILQIAYSPEGRYLAVSHGNGLVSILLRRPLRP